MNPFLSHCLEIARRHGIRLRYVNHENKCRARIDEKLIYTLPVKNMKGYLATLHEFAHVILKTRDEKKAWRYVKQVSIGWNKACESFMVECLESHGLDSKGIGYR